MKKVAGYRRMLDLTQGDMAKKMGISKQSYWLKENNRVSFSDSEKIIFRDLLDDIFPDISIDEIFFEKNAKKYKENKRR